MRDVFYLHFVVQHGERLVVVGQGAFMRKTPPPLEPPHGPRHRSTVGS